MNRPFSVLAFAAAYLPGYKSGGPIQSIANIVDHLGGEFNFFIITRDRDAGDREQFPSVVVKKWQIVGRAKVKYLPLPEIKLTEVSRLMRRTRHEVVYLNSFFNWRFSVLPLLAQRLRLVPRKPVILAPRGEFSPGALAIKPLKKRAFLIASRLTGLHRHVLWQASSEYEAADIRAVLGPGEAIHVASNLPRAVQQGLPHVSRSPSQPIRLLFLSRISPKKNLTFLFEVLERVNVRVDLSIVGPISDPTYWRECEAQIAKLPEHVTVNYNGVIPSEKAPSVMAKNDLFCLPTLGENFGHAIIEALGAGTPALISDQTPWKNLEEAGCGWVLPLANPKLFAERIDEMFHESPEDHMKRRKSAISYAREFSSNSQIVEDNKEMFLRAVKAAI